MSELTHNITDIARCAAQYRTEELAPLGLKACHGSYLQEICACPGISQEQLAKRICINKSNVARQAAALEEAGYIERKTCGNDKRVMRLYPTEKTLALLPEIDRIMLSWQQRLTQDLSEQERELLARMLQKVKQRASEYLEEE